MRFYHRHAALVRVTHWLNAGLFLLMLMSGLQIFNAHPALYLGNISDFDHPILEIGARDHSSRGALVVFGHALTTTGWLGLFPDASGGADVRAFPSWATLPGPQSLAEGRRLHFFFAFALLANALIYWLFALGSGHLWRDLLPSRAELVALPRTAFDHLRLRFPRGAAAMHYNGLQQLTYLLVIAVLFPTLVLSGLTMSPRLDAQWPWLLELFGGRQSARSVHFLMAFFLVGFVLVHLAMVLLSGVWNNLRSMITGRYAVAEENADAH